jgi:hypothetical protein
VRVRGGPGLLMHARLRFVSLVVVFVFTKPARHQGSRYFFEMHLSMNGIVVVRRRRWRFSGSGGDARGSESGVTLVPTSGTYGKSGEMDDQYGLRSVSVNSQQWLDQAPKVADAMKRGSPVSIAPPGVAGSCRVRAATESIRVCCWRFARRATVPAGTSFAGV